MYKTDDRILMQVKFLSTRSIQYFAFLQISFPTICHLFLELPILFTEFLVNVCIYRYADGMILMNSQGLALWRESQKGLFQYIS